MERALGSLCFASLLTPLHTLHLRTPDRFSPCDAGGASHQGALSLHLLQPLCGDEDIGHRVLSLRCIKPVTIFSGWFL